MAGYLRISSQSTWTAAGWIYDAVIEAATPTLRQFDASLESVALRARRHVGSGSLDVSSWSPEALRVLRNAVLELRRNALAAGPQAFHDPTFFPGCMARLDELLELLERDPRANNG